MAQQINLYNPIFLQKRKHFSAVTMLQTLGVVLAGILVFYVYALSETQKLTKLADNTRAQLASQSEQVGQMTREFSPEGTSRLLNEEIARATTRLKQREDLLAVLRTGGLGNTEGFARYLSALARQALPGVWLTGFSIAGDEAALLITGRVVHSDLVPEYIRALNREEVMRGRRVAELRLTAKEVREAPATAPPGGTSAPGEALKPPAEPQRYVEFSMSAVRGPAVSTTPAPTGAAKGAN